MTFWVSQVVLKVRHIYQSGWYKDPALPSTPRSRCRHLFCGDKEALYRSGLLEKISSLLHFQQAHYRNAFRWHFASCRAERLESCITSCRDSRFIGTQEGDMFAVRGDKRYQLFPLDSITNVTTMHFFGSCRKKTLIRIGVWSLPG